MRCIGASESVSAMVFAIGMPVNCSIQYHWPLGLISRSGVRV